MSDRIASISKARNHTTTPLPGRPVRGSRTGRAANALLDLLGRRWALRILWELRHEGTTLTFRELQANCGDASSSGGYALSAHGRELIPALSGLEEWANRWARRQRM
jgi:DNA-binding HxlR family transcriptional regulator